ncbi:MAG: hypothetical protein IJZ31_11030 [Bacteroidaceae bacterium]|nr:hypothetical protein [Bacteroidaceae bacterium]
MGHPYFYYEEGKKIAITRDADGRVIKLDDSNPYGCGTNYSFVYDEKGNISSLSGKDGFTYECNSTLHYDKDNYLEKSIIKGTDVEYESITEENYTYTQMDEFGNWIERRVDILMKIAEEGAKPVNKKFKQIEKREILYY